MNLIIKFHHLGQITDIADSFWLVLWKNLPYLDENG